MRRNILITGASSGLGAEMARQFAAKGHHLALTARRVDRLEELRSEILAAHPDVEVVVHQLDVNDHDQVFAVTKQAAADLGGLDRVVVNAGLGKGVKIGTGGFAANAETAQTNFVAALAQCEAAMEHFYERKAGHLVVISSISAMRGLPSTVTTYAATKAGLAHLAEGIRLDLMGRKNLDIKVTTIYPGYIVSEMNDVVASEQKLMADTATGVRSIVKAIDKEVAEASVPGWPWVPLGQVLKRAPLGIVRKLV
ncbi:oxidoreductase, short chain dehydrogenase/reductase family protein [Aeromicrobium marinum DSM 15272]|uniref:Oxidoreductase, short chain dehydrogenase/reductase family protein n=1 Tax=Aeromicrobium marinum DSM 15272 TaxID=585531 RepID=E2S8F6_9ACTN|nr:SDR family oxidoreductase [Aeromicrobium marinum]EFQ84461.1 oxidoreductase, short chain dehydrogenase/reductase family protein [Aeromicrobium marinum DSM 15272]